jgi:hypothetical protein
LVGTVASVIEYGYRDIEAQTTISPARVSVYTFDESVPIAPAGPAEPPERAERAGPPEQASAAECSNSTPAAVPTEVAPPEVAPEVTRVYGD